VFGITRCMPVMHVQRIGKARPHLMAR
jgi:hypothetical protein